MHHYYDVLIISQKLASRQLGLVLDNVYHMSDTYLELLQPVAVPAFKRGSNLQIKHV